MIGPNIILFINIFSFLFFFFLFFFFSLSFFFFEKKRERERERERGRERERERERGGVWLSFISVCWTVRGSRKEASNGGWVKKHRKIYMKSFFQRHNIDRTNFTRQIVFLFFLLLSLNPSVSFIILFLCLCKSLVVFLTVCIP